MPTPKPIKILMRDLGMNYAEQMESEGNIYYLLSCVSKNGEVMPTGLPKIAYVDGEDAILLSDKDAFDILDKIPDDEEEDGLKYCRYYKGEDDFHYEYGFLASDYAWFERNYFCNQGSTPKGRKNWKPYFPKMTILSDPLMQEQFSNPNMSDVTKGFLVYTIDDILLRSPMPSLEFLVYYGMDELVRILDYSKRQGEVHLSNCSQGGTDIQIPLMKRAFSSDELITMARIGYQVGHDVHSIYYSKYSTYLSCDDKNLARLQWVQRGRDAFYIRYIQTLSDKLTADDIQTAMLDALHKTYGLTVGDEYDKIDKSSHQVHERLNRVTITFREKRACQNDTFELQYFLATGEGTYNFGVVVDRSNNPLPYMLTSVLTKQNIENLYTARKRNLDEDACCSTIFKLRVSSSLGECELIGDYRQYDSPIIDALREFTTLKYSHCDDFFEKNISPILKVFKMVSCLHGAGYQQLRLCTAVSPNGYALRCWLTTKHNCTQLCGAMHAEDTPETTVLLVNGCAAWISEDMSAYEMSEAFLTKFPQLAKKCKRLDPDYVEWFQRAVDECEMGHVMYNSSDGEVCLREGYIMLTGVEDRGLPFPPKSYSKLPPVEY